MRNGFDFYLQKKSGRPQFDIKRNKLQKLNILDSPADQYEIFDSEEVEIFRNFSAGLRGTEYGVHGARCGLRGNGNIHRP